MRVVIIKVKILIFDGQNRCVSRLSESVGFQPKSKL